MQRLTRLVFKIFVFLLPTQLAYHFWPDWALIFGIRVDYLAPTLYLSDIFALVLIFLYFFQKNKTRTDKSLLVPIAVLIFAATNIFLAKIPPAAFFKWLKILELYLIFVVVQNYRPLDFYKDFLKPLTYSSLIISLIGTLQFLKGSTLGGPLYFLGERSFNLFTPGIALVRIKSQDFLRAYSIFSHPNSLAGFLSVSIILLVNYWKKRRSKFLATISLIAIIVCFFLTFSLGATVSLAFVFLSYKLIQKHPRAALALVLFGSATLLIFSTTKGAAKYTENVQERLVFASFSKKIFLQNPIIGSGLNNFTAAKISWSLQPVHNIYLLVLSETGLIGLLLFVLLLTHVLTESAKLQNKGLFMSLLFILFSGLVDHYNLTLQQNLLLFSLLLGYSLKRKGND